jgi:hypothetical protein
VREYARYLVGYDSTTVPSQDELQAFENGKGSGPTVQSFRLDLASDGLASKWNAQAAEIFADAFLQEEELAAQFSDRDATVSAFVVHLVTLQKHYKHPIRRAEMTEAELNGERDKEKLKTRDQRRRGVRTYFLICMTVLTDLQLFRRRKNATKDYSSDSMMAPLLDNFWSHCTPEVMSDDETDAEWEGPKDQSPHFVSILKWRNPEVVDFFRILDGLYFSTRFKDNKWSPGRFPHTRVPSLRVKYSDAVPGLPENFYNPVWLAQLSDIERRKLRIKEKINLGFSVHILRCVCSAFLRFSWSLNYLLQDRGSFSSYQKS